MSVHLGVNRKGFILLYCMATQQHNYGERYANYASSAKSQTRDPEKDTLKALP